MPLIYSMTLIYLSFLNKKIIAYLIMNIKQCVNSEQKCKIIYSTPNMN